jgi:membrane protein
MAKEAESGHTLREAGQHVKARSEHLKERYQGTSAEHLVRRLGAVDVVNRAMLFSAVLLLCFFPFLIVASALAGRSAASGLSRHLGLNHQAASYVGALFASSSATSNAVTGAGYVFFILGGIAAASAVQDLYERSFEVESRGMGDILRRLAWLAIVVGVSSLTSWAAPAVHRAGGPALVVLAAAPLLVMFWWFTAWFLLAGRIRWRAVLPTAIATTVFWIGMELVFFLTFSNMVIANHRKYGPIGVVFSLMSWLIAIGVVIVLGAVVGIVWRERGLHFRSALSRIRTPLRPRSPGSATRDRSPEHAHRCSD